MPTAFIQSSASANVQRIIQELLKGPAALKKAWLSSEGAASIAAIGSLIVSVLVYQLMKEQGAQTAAFDKALVEQS
jgi:hypothetical protein